MMKQLLSNFRGISFKSIIALVMFYLPGLVWAQVPRDIPSDTGPLEVDSTFDIILYIVLPIIVIIFFIIYLINKNKNKRNENQEK